MTMKREKESTSRAGRKIKSDASKKLRQEVDQFVKARHQTDTLDEMADGLGVKKSKIRSSMKRQGLKKSTGGRPKLTDEDIANMSSDDRKRMQARRRRENRTPDEKYDDMIKAEEARAMTGLSPEGKKRMKAILKAKEPYYKKWFDMGEEIRTLQSKIKSVKKQISKSDQTAYKEYLSLRTKIAGLKEERIQLEIEMKNATNKAQKDTGVSVR